MFVVLEGLDRSGKFTQLRMLAKYFASSGIRLGETVIKTEQLTLGGHIARTLGSTLSLAKQLETLEQIVEHMGMEVETFSFPQYTKTIWGKMIGQGLRGEFGRWDQLNPYITSVFYALDRAEAAPKIRKALKEGKLVISDRYTTSNILFQGAKFDSERELNRFVRWLEDFEYNYLKIPKPDMVLFLDVTPETTFKLAMQAYKQNKKKYLKGAKDLHEENTELMARAYKVALWYMEQRPNYFIRINCVDEEGNLLPPTEIASNIINLIKEKLR